MNRGRVVISSAADTAAIQRGGGVLLRKRFFLYLQCGRGLPRAGGSGWQYCERDYFCTDKVARGRATSRGGFLLRRLGMHTSNKA